MTYRKIITIDGGSAQYWRDRKEGFRLIREAEEAIEHLKHEPMYIAGAWDDDYGDYEPVENLEPLDDLEDAIRAVEADETAVSILVAQRCTRIGNHQIRAVIRELALLNDGGSDENPEGDDERLHGPNW